MTEPKTKVLYREEWLDRGVRELKKLFKKECDIEVPEVRVSVGFPSTRATAKNRVVGECWAAEASIDSTAQIFISPTEASSVTVLGILTHELIHAALGAGAGHKAPFQKAARAVGLEAPWTSTKIGADLFLKLTNVAEELGQYPHSAIAVGARATKKQTTRMLKVVCPEGTGYVVRLTRKWIDEHGAPFCPCEEHDHLDQNTHLEDRRMIEED